jgi:hypothetical protein
MSYLALARAALLRGNERSEESEKSEETHASRGESAASATGAWDSSHNSLTSQPYAPAEGSVANDHGDLLESVGIVLDEAGDPALPCATCGGHAFHRPPGDWWRCSACESPTLPGDAEAMGRWQFCSLPPGPDDPAQDGPPGAVGGTQDADPALGGLSGTLGGRSGSWRSAPGLERRPGVDLAMAHCRAGAGRPSAGARGLDRGRSTAAAAPVPRCRRIGPDRGPARNHGRDRATECPAGPSRGRPGARFGPDPLR